METSRISAQEFKLLNDKELVTIVDVRTPIEVSGEHITGSLFLPVQELTPEKFNQLISTLPNSNKPIYLLCQRGIRADMAVKKLKEVEKVHLIVIEGGLNELKAKGQVTAVGVSNVISLERQVRIASGAFILFGMLLGVTVHSYFYAIPTFMGMGLVFSGITNLCGLGLVIARMPWNQ